MKRALARKEPTQDRARVTVEALLDATAKVLVSEGYEGLTTNKVAARAGVSVGSLYQYFDNKEQLVRAVGERHHEQLMAVLGKAGAAVAAETPLPEMMDTIIGAMLEAHAVDPKLHRVLSEQIPHTIIMKHVEEDGAAFVRAMFEIHQHKIRKDIDVDVGVFVLVHAVEGITHAAVIEHPEMLRQRALKQEIAKLVTSYLAA
jgi:AcrR family transcriptional regulator